MKTLNNGRGIDKISTAQHAHQVRVELRNLYPRRAMHCAQKSNSPVETLTRRALAAANYSENNFRPFGNAVCSGCVTQTQYFMLIQNEPRGVDYGATSAGSL